MGSRRDGVDREGGGGGMGIRGPFLGIFEAFFGTRKDYDLCIVLFAALDLWSEFLWFMGIVGWCFVC